MQQAKSKYVYSYIQETQTTVRKIGFEKWISKQKKPIQPEVFSPVPTFFNGGLISIS
jgi:hypothetical protein